MRASDLSAIVRTLSSFDEPYNVVCIEIPEDFFREDCSDRYVNSWKTTCPNGTIHHATLSELLARQNDFASGPSLFGDRELWIIEKASEGKVKKTEGLLDLLLHADKRYSFLFVESSSFPKELSTFAEEHGLLCTLLPMRPWDVPPLIEKWIQAWMKKQGKLIDGDAAAILAKAYTGQRESLLRELEQLYLLCLDESKITKHHIEQIGMIEVQPTLWQLLDGLLNGNASIVASSRTDDIYPIAIARFLVNQLEKLIEILESGAPAKNKSQERQLVVARKRGIPTLISWINKLKMYEVGIRSGTEEANFDTLLLSLLSCISDAE